jgi:leader peptidase (prepilin peptidase) / N-methyltransferase
MPLELLHSPVFLIFIFICGACIGSFLNVCIYRIPLEISVITPRSHCAACGSPILAHHNIPILSWFMLRGRSSCCQTRIDARYAVVEALTGALFVLLWHRFPPQIFAVYALMSCGLIIASCIDIDHFMIPDRFTIWGCIPGLLCSALVPVIHGKTDWQSGFNTGLWGAFVGGVILFIVSKVGAFVFKKEALGLGDVKFLAAMGSFLSWPSTLYILAVSSIIGSVFGILVLVRKERSWGTRMPYGPFLAVAALLWIFGGNEWSRGYFDLWKELLFSSPPAP